MSCRTAPSPTERAAAPNTASPSEDLVHGAPAPAPSRRARHTASVTLVRVAPPQPIESGKGAGCDRFTDQQYYHRELHGGIHRVNHVGCVQLTDRHQYTDSLANGPAPEPGTRPGPGALSPTSTRATRNRFHPSPGALPALTRRSARSPRGRCHGTRVPLRGPPCAHGAMRSLRVLYSHDAHPRCVRCRAQSDRSLQRTRVRFAVHSLRPERSGRTSPNTSSRATHDAWRSSLRVRTERCDSPRTIRVTRSTDARCGGPVCKSSRSDTLARSPIFPCRSPLLRSLPILTISLNPRASFRQQHDRASRHFSDRHHGPLGTRLPA